MLDVGGIFSKMILMLFLDMSQNRSMNSHMCARNPNQILYLPDTPIRGIGCWYLIQMYSIVDKKIYLVFLIR